MGCAAYGSSAVAVLTPRACVLQCIVTLWRSIQHQLAEAEHAAARDALVEDFAGPHLLNMLDVLMHTRSDDGEVVDLCAPVFDIAALLPATAAEGLSDVRGSSPPLACLPAT